MSVPLALVLFAFVVMTAGPRWLRGRTWAQGSPRMGILAWQAAVLSVLSALVLLALTAALPVTRVSFDLGHVIHACPEALRRSYDTVDLSWVRVASAVVAAATFLALSWAVLTRGVAVRRGRVRQRQVLDLLGRERQFALCAHVLEHDVPLAYCVPGGGGRIVLTTAAVAALDERQLTAVLAHEHAHLDGRHDLVLFGADVAAAAFPWSSFFRTARAELRTLIEMLADDEASRRSDPLVLATALVDLGQTTAPTWAIGATGDTVIRVERLIARQRRLSRARRLLAVSLSVVLLLAPWAIAVAPAWAARAGHCPAG